MFFFVRRVGAHITIGRSTLCRKAKLAEERTSRRASMLKAELEVEKKRNLIERKRKVGLQALVTECEVRNIYIKVALQALVTECDVRNIYIKVALQALVTECEVRNIYINLG